MTRRNKTYINTLRLFSADTIEDSKLLHEAIQLASQTAPFQPIPLFSTPDAALYEHFFKQAKEDSSKPPRERRAFIMPPEKEDKSVIPDLEYLMFTTGQSPEDIRFAPKEHPDKVNPDICDFLLGEFGQAYFEFVGTNVLGFKPLIEDELKNLPGTVPIQLVFESDGRYYCSNINGRARFHREEVRGIKQIID